MKPHNMQKVCLGKLRTEYKGNIFTIHTQHVTFDDGTTAIYEYCERPASVSILAFNEKNQLLLIKENRVGYKKSTWFLPGGRADHKGDTPRTAAIRELREEAGYKPKTIKLVHKKAPASTLLWDIYLFAARDLVFDPLPKDKGEVIETYFFPLKTAVQMALDGTIDNEFISYNIIRFEYMLRHGQFKW